MKIKAPLALLIVAFSILSFSFVADGSKILTPGIGVKGEIELGDTKEAVVKKLGNDFTEKTFYTKKGTDSVLYSSSLFFEKQGITTWFKTGENKVFTIYFHSKFSGVTEKNIQLGVSTMHDVERAYGKSEWYTNRNSLFFEYNGIAFHTPFQPKFPIKKSVKKKLMKAKVEYISIKEKNE